MRKRYYASILGLNFPPEPTGIAPYAGALAAGLSRSGKAVAAHVAHPHYPEWTIAAGYGQWTRRDHIEGVDVTRRLHYVPANPRGLHRLLSELTFGMRLALASWGKPAAVIAISPSLFATSIAVLRTRLTRPGRRPALIVWVQDIYTLGLLETNEGSRLTQRVTRWVESYTLRAADRVVAIHPRFKQFLVSELGVESSRAVVIRNWTHLPRSHPLDSSSARTALGWPQNTLLAVHTGNMGSKQGLENIVSAARLADERDAQVCFILVGDGGERRVLKELAHGVSRLIFVDPLEADEYRFALCAADVLVVNEKPGVSSMAVPSKLTSYFDAGKPIVAATDPDGITASEVLTAEAGIVVSAGNPAELLDAVMRIGEDAESASEFGRNGQRYRDSVLEESFAIDQWKKLLSSVLPEHGHRYAEG